jgi:hypothetical protein
MLKLSTSYMKKIPVGGTDFSSQSFHASVELELSDALTPEQIRGRIHDSAELLRRAVDDELSGAAPAAPSQSAFTGERQPQAGERKASNKQVKYLTDLAAERKVTLTDLNADIRRRFGVENVYDLSAKQASALIDEMNGKERRRAA